MNGCCRTNPCLNGGACTEHCDDVTVKFECSCAAGFAGKICDNVAPMNNEIEGSADGD